MKPSSERTVIIDCFPESALRYRKCYAVVAIDVVRATTTAITAANDGRRCYPVSTLKAAFDLARELDQPLLVGEQGGVMPYGFDLNNSPSALAARSEDKRPIVQLSSSGTRLCHEAGFCEVAYLASFQNWLATAEYLARQHPQIVLIGAGSRRDFREEDQMCCSWIAAYLIEAGYAPRGELTLEAVQRWRDAPIDAWTHGKSAAYLQASGQVEDFNFILAHVNDISEAFTLEGGEVKRASPDPGVREARRRASSVTAGLTTSGPKSMEGR